MFLNLYVLLALRVRMKGYEPSRVNSLQVTFFQKVMDVSKPAFE